MVGGVVVLVVVEGTVDVVVVEVLVVVLLVVLVDPGAVVVVDVPGTVVVDVPGTVVGVEVDVVGDFEPGLFGTKAPPQGPWSPALREGTWNGFTGWPGWLTPRANTARKAAVIRPRAAVLT